jgi:uncharacterized protein DUF4430
MRRLVVLLALLAAGCGFGSGSSSGGTVTIRVTQNFGHSELAPAKSDDATSGETVMRLLQRHFTVVTKYGGGFVQEIDGVSGGRAKGRQVDWFYYVNGVEASNGAADHKISPGDRVWWDHHDWGAAQRIPAVVGAFPEPFQSGIGGKKLPIRLVCMGDAGRSCDEVEQRLQQAGVRTIARSNLEQSVGKVLRVLVGAWPDVRKDIAAQQLEKGPQASGVFAKPSSDGRQMQLLDSEGRVQRTLGGASGLVAATSFADQEPTWLVTGTDEVGVAAAAAAVTQEQLRDRFALAIEAGKSVPLPLEAP